MSLSSTELTDLKNEFISIFKANITRNGAEELLRYLENSDFFTAPASTKFHLNYPGGLLPHSINVYKELNKLNENYNLGFSPESVAICGLLHDACKIKFYEKTSTGSYKVFDTFQVPHGSKSVIRLQQFIKLNRDEVLAIVHHMGAWDSAVKGGDTTINDAKKTTKLVGALQIADLQATYLIEA